MSLSPPKSARAKTGASLGKALAAVLENKKSPRDDPVPAQEIKAELALSIKSDRRFKQMDAFTRQKKAVPLPNLPLASLPRPHTVAGGEAERAAPQGASEPSSPISGRTDAKSRQRDAGVDLSTLTGEERSRVPKALWQDSVDRSIKRLMVDFDLTDEPSCRLHHLERMHDWFLRHGPKGKAAQPESSADGPSYLRAERNTRQPAPAGSMQGFSGVLSPTSELMSSMYSPRNYTRPITRG